jgi:hypothetical protein
MNSPDTFRRHGIDVTADELKFLAGPVNPLEEQDGQLRVAGVPARQFIDDHRLSVEAQHRSKELTVDEYLALFEGCDTGRVELMDGIVWIGGQPFQLTVEGYLAPPTSTRPGARPLESRQPPPAAPRLEARIWGRTKN